MSETNHQDVQLFAVTASGPVPLPVSPAARSFDDLYEGLALGVYSALRTFAHHQFLYLAAHIERTRQSMVLLGWDYQLDEAALRRALHTVCSAYHRPEARVRFDVLAEPAWALGTDSRLLIALMPFTPPSPDMVANGVRVDLALDLERTRPLAKTADFAVTRRRYPGGQAGGVSPGFWQAFSWFFSCSPVWFTGVFVSLFCLNRPQPADAAQVQLALHIFR